MGKSKSGFTIVELLIVIVVIGILASITVVAFNGVRARALESEKSSKFTTVYKSLLNFYAINGYYPTSGTISGSAGAALIGLTLKDVEPSNAASPGTGIEGGYPSADQTHIRYIGWPTPDGSLGGNQCGVDNKCLSFQLYYWDNLKNEAIVLRNPGHRGY